MKKIQLLVLLLLPVLYFQACKKDAITSASTASDKILSANINGVAWNPDSVSASVLYNTTSKIKTFNVIGTVNSKRIIFNLSIFNSINTNNFPLATYKVDSTTKVKMNYYIPQLNNGSYVYTQVGVVEPGSGFATITAIDTVKNVITGNFSFTAKKVNYNPDGSYRSIEISQILSGSFTKLPYLFNNNN